MAPLSTQRVSRKHSALLYTGTGSFVWGRGPRGDHQSKKERRGEGSRTKPAFALSTVIYDFDCMPISSTIYSQAIDDESE